MSQWLGQGCINYQEKLGKLELAFLLFFIFTWVTFTLFQGIRKYFEIQRFGWIKLINNIIAHFEK